MLVDRMLELFYQNKIRHLQLPDREISNLYQTLHAESKNQNTFINTLKTFKEQEHPMHQLPKTA